MRISKERKTQRKIASDYLVEIATEYKFYINSRAGTQGQLRAEVRDSFEPFKEILEAIFKVPLSEVMPLVVARTQHLFPLQRTFKREKKVCSATTFLKRARKKKVRKKRRGSRIKVRSSKYDKYLKSSLWRKIIRPRVLKRDSNKCQICGEIPKKSYLCVHHICYNKEVMAGEDDTQLITLCKRHHTQIEFEKGKRLESGGRSKRRKRSTEEVQVALLRYLDRKTSYGLPYAERQKIKHRILKD